MFAESRTSVVVVVHGVRVLVYHLKRKVIEVDRVLASGGWALLCEIYRPYTVIFDMRTPR